MPGVRSDPLAPLLERPGAGEAVARARSAVDALLRHQMLRRRSAEVSAESALRGAWASCALSGSDVTLAALRAGAIDDPIVQGALRVSGELGAVADTWTRAPRQVLARLHLLAAADLVGDRARLGRPVAAGVGDRLDQLVETLSATRAPAVVVAAIVRAELLSLDAFAPASMVVANAAARLTLVERGLDPKSLVAIEVGSWERRAEEVAALAGYRTGSAAGVVGWLSHTAETVRLGAREALAICEAMQRG
ncbi:MAG: oxidoreductase [Actinomycetota bacterium]|nr:oxidoreductase [Actinomycetota bacterium]